MTLSVDQIERKSGMDKEALEYVGGAIIGGLIVKYIPANMTFNLGSYLTLGVGLALGVAAYFVPSHKDLQRILMGGAVFDVVDGIFRIFVPSLAL